MKFKNTIIKIVAILYTLTACSSLPEVEKISVNNLKERKIEILEAAQRFSASIEEKAIIISIASIETETMENNYPPGDGKSGGAYNVSIFKMNIDMINDIDPQANHGKIHNEILPSVEILLRGLRKFGVEKFLIYHRGGKGAFDGTMHMNKIQPYVAAIHRIAKEYMKDSWQLDPRTTNNQRYTIFVKAI